jgi:hypothetical protein
LRPALGSRHLAAVAHALAARYAQFYWRSDRLELEHYRSFARAALLCCVILAPGALVHFAENELSLARRALHWLQLAAYVFVPCAVSERAGALHVRAQLVSRPPLVPPRLTAFAAARAAATARASAPRPVRRRARVRDLRARQGAALLP